jgi:hypothetical protein
MKPVNNSNETASPRGGVESIVKRTQSTATQVNTIRLKTWTSPRVDRRSPPMEDASGVPTEPSPLDHGGCGGAFWVVGGSRLSRGSAREDGRPARADRWRQRRAGVRAAIVAWKPGNAGGAKGGRKWKVGAEREPSEQCHRLPCGLERHGLKALALAAVTRLSRNPCGPGGVSSSTRGTCVPRPDEEVRKDRIG